MRAAELMPAGHHMPPGLVAALPDFEPENDLWARILGAHQQRRRRRHWSIAAAVASAAGMVLLLVGIGIQTPAGDPLVALQDESSSLQASLRAAPAPPPAADWWQQTLADAANAELRHVDAELQAAYDRGAHPAELERLWQRRATVLRSLLATARDAHLITRI